MKGDYKNFWKASHCSFGFLFLFNSLNSIQNIQSQMLEDDGYGKLGFYSNAALYLALGIGSIIATAVMNKIGTIKTITLGAILCVPFMVSFILSSVPNDYHSAKSILFSPAVVYTVIIMFSFVCGIGESIMWVGQGKYIADCATERNKGFFFGYFWAYYMASQIIGNLIAAIVLGRLSQTMYIVIMSILAILSTIIFATMRNPELFNQIFPSKKASMEPLPEYIDNLRSKQHSTNRDDYLSDIKSVIKMTLSKRMRLMIPLCVWTGISIAYYSGVLVCMITDMMSPEVSKQQQYERSMMAMVVFGIGEMFGCFFIGYIVDKMGSKFAAIVDVIICILMTLVTLWFLYIKDFTWVAFLMTFMWGFQDSATNTHLAEMLGFEFENNSEPYSVFNLTQSIAVFAFELIETYVESYNAYIWYTVITGILAVVSCGATYFFDFKPRHHKHDEQIEQEQSEIQLMNSSKTIQIDQ